MNQGSNCMKHVLVIVWCAGILLLGGCSDTEEGTWQQEYKHCMAAMEMGIPENGAIVGQDLPSFQKETRNEKIALWRDSLRDSDECVETAPWQASLRALDECVETCIRIQPGGMDGEEGVYRTATLLMAAMCERYNSSYEFKYEHGKKLEKAQEDFRAVIEGENPIDENMASLNEEFGIYNYADSLISDMLSEAWQEEFQHCLDMAGNEVEQSDAANKEQLLEVLEAYGDFFGVLADNEEEYRWQAESRAEVFRIGTMLLIDGMEKSGSSYEFIYNSAAYRQELSGLLGVFSDTEEGTWKQEYEICIAAMKLGISRCGIAGEQELLDDEKWARNGAVALWQDSINAFGECVEACIKNQTGGMDGEEDIYRSATLLMAAMCEEHNDTYEFVHEHGVDMEKAQEDFRAVIEAENPIDEIMDSFYEEFGIYYDADTLICEMLSEAWQKEFYHCLDMVENEVKQSVAADKEQLLEVLEAYGDFFDVWADNEEGYRVQEFRYEVWSGNKEICEWMRAGGGLSIWQAESRAEVFRIGTMLLIDGLEKSGGSYEFIYDSAADRQELPYLLEICPDTEKGTWKQEYEICTDAMKLGISRYDVTGANVPYENMPYSDQYERDRSMELWRNSLRAFDKCVETCVRNQTGGMDGEEDTYRMAVLLIKVMCESRNGHYSFVYEHSEDTEKALENFKTIIERENPIDENIDSLHESFDSYYYAETIICERMSEAWQEEFYHCLDMVRSEVKQSDAADKEQILEILEAWEDFFEVWAEDEGQYHHIQSGTGMHAAIAFDRAKVFRIGTMLLIDGLERSGGSYEFIYDSEADKGL